MSGAVEAAGRRVARRRWPWPVAGLAALLAAGSSYLVGVQQTLTVATDVEEKCTVILGQRYDPGYGARRWWPLSRRCNGAFDMVGAWVTPTVVVLTVVALGCLVTSVVLARRPLALGSRCIAAIHRGVR